MLLPLFSSNQSLCSSNDPSEPINKLIAFVIKQITDNSLYILKQIKEGSDKIEVELFKPAKDNQTGISQPGNSQTGNNNNNNNEFSKGVISTVIGGIVYVGGIVIVQTGNVIYSLFFPTKLDTANTTEADVRIKEAQKRSAFLDAEASFSKCLKNIKKDAERNAVGIPTVCETKARDLILCDGEAAVILMMKNFNK